MTTNNIHIAVSMGALVVAFFKVSEINSVPDDIDENIKAELINVVFYQSPKIKKNYRKLSFLKRPPLREAANKYQGLVSFVQS